MTDTTKYDLLKIEFIFLSNNTSSEIIPINSAIARKCQDFKKTSALSQLEGVVYIQNWYNDLTSKKLQHYISWLFDLAQKETSDYRGEYEKSMEQQAKDDLESVVKMEEEEVPIKEEKQEDKTYGLMKLRGTSRVSIETTEIVREKLFGLKKLNDYLISHANNTSTNKKLMTHCNTIIDKCNGLNSKLICCISITASGDGELFTCSFADGTTMKPLYFIDSDTEADIEIEFNQVEFGDSFDVCLLKDETEGIKTFLRKTLKKEMKQRLESLGNPDVKPVILVNENLKDLITKHTVKLLDCDTIIIDKIIAPVAEPNIVLMDFIHNYCDLNNYLISPLNVIDSLSKKKLLKPLVNNVYAKCGFSIQKNVCTMSKDVNELFKQLNVNESKSYDVIFEDAEGNEYDSNGIKQLNKTAKILLIFLLTTTSFKDLKTKKEQIVYLSHYPVLLGKIMETLTDELI